MSGNLGLSKIIIFNVIEKLESSYKRYIEMQKTNAQPFSSDYIQSIMNELEEYKRKFIMFEPQTNT